MTLLGLVYSDPLYTYKALLNTFRTRIRIFVPLTLLTALGADPGLISLYITKRKLRLALGSLCQAVGSLVETDDTVPLSVLERLAPGIANILDVIPPDLSKPLLREVLTRSLPYLDLESLILEDRDCRRLIQALPFILLFDYVTASSIDYVSQVVVKQTDSYYCIYVRYHTYRNFIFVIEVRKKSCIVENLRIVTPDGSQILALYETPDISPF